jgi:hypothetical protein
MEPETEAPEPDSTSSRPWLDLIQDAGKAFESWHARCDRAKENYASLKRLSNESGSKEMQLLYANIEVLKPTIYARPPVPVCKTRFSDRKPVNRTASEVIERCLMVSFDAERIHDTMLHIRDDVTLFGRGVMWLRYKTEGGMAEMVPNSKQDDQGAEGGDDEAKEGYGEADDFFEYVCYDHVNRADFLHEPVRTWSEVGWVARRSWLTREQGMRRFGDSWREIQYVEAENDTAEEYKVEKKAEVWELWHKGQETVVWVHKGSKELLDRRDPWLDLDGFYPCPKPAYSVCEPESLIPVPDYLFYRDQLEEVNTLTARISALSDALRMKGFYSAGGEDIGTALEKAFQSQDDNAVMIPVPTVAALGQGMQNAILFMPLMEIASTVSALVTLRKQLIEDIYQISGISDIMRGETKASETATAQNIKAQFGSVRVRSRQEEMVRVADDAMKIAGEIIAENFQPQTIMQMCQMDKLVPGALIQQHEALKAQQAQMAQQMQLAQQSGQPPQPMPQMPQLPPLPKDAIAAEEVLALLRNERMRPFVLQTASDSTIQPNEDAEKQRRNEFAQAVGNLMVSSGPIVQAAPEAAKLVAEMLRFVTGAYRAGRAMEQTIDDFIEELSAKAAQPPQPPPPDPKIEAMKMDAQMRQQEAQMDAQMKQGEAQMRAQEMQAMMQVKGMEAQARMAEIQAKAQHDQMMAGMNERLKQMDLQLKAFDLQLAEMRLAETQVKTASQPFAVEIR